MAGVWAREGLDDGAWFHGSPERLEVLREGSTVTRCRVVAEAFSHKPSCVGTSGDPPHLQVCHNGTRSGYLYVVAEALSQADVHPHPRSSFPGGGLEWLTDRPLRLRLVAELPAGEAAECEQCSHRPAPGSQG